MKIVIEVSEKKEGTKMNKCDCINGKILERYPHKIIKCKKCNKPEIKKKSHDN